MRRMTKTRGRDEGGGAQRRPKRPPAPGRTRRIVRGVVWSVAAIAFVGAVGGAVWAWRSGFAARQWDRAKVVANTEAVRLTRTIGFSVDQVLVEGRVRTSPEQIRKALAVHKGQAIVGVDLEAARARVEALPWVRTAMISRRLPDTLFVRLIEREPLALWQKKGKLSLIDRSGTVILRDAGNAYADLPVVVGPDAPRHAADLLRMLASEPALRKRVTAAVRVGGRRWNIVMTHGIEVLLPEENPERAWRILASAQRKHGLLDRDVVAVDLRLPDELIVRTNHSTQPLRGNAEKST